MGLTGNNNLSSNQTVSREDIKAIVKEVMSAERADQYTEERDKAQAAAADPEVKTKALVASASEREKAVFSGDIAKKDLSDFTAKDRVRLMARMIQCRYQAEQRGSPMVEVAKDAGQDSIVKAVQATDFDNGGYMLSPGFADEVIPELVAKAVYINAGPATVDLPEGGLSLPYDDAAGEATWNGEGTEVNAVESTGGRFQLQPQKLTVIQGISNDILRARVGSNDDYIVGKLRRRMMSTLDSTLINSDGSQSEPRGMDSFVLTANTQTATPKATLTQALLVQELIYMQTLVEQGNVDLSTDNPWYFMSPRTKNYLRAQRATDGLLFPELESSNRILGAQVGSTSNVANDISTNKSEIFFAAMNWMILGRTSDFLVSMFPGGTYNDSSGNKRSGISADETVVSIITKWDHHAQQRGKELARLDTVDWQ